MNPPPPTFLIGQTLPINRLGYGAMRLTGQPGNFGPYDDWFEGRRLLRRAVDIDINFIDTANAYGPGFNEELIGEALDEYATGVVVATKGGVEKTSPTNIYPDGRPEALRKSCNLSLRRLRLDVIPLYQLHRPDPKVPFADSVGALAELRSEGKILHVGLSNVSLEQLQAAQRIVPIASVQNRYNLDERSDDPVLDYCTSQNIAYIPWGPLAAKPLEPGARVAASRLLDFIARAHGATTSQIALAWLLHRAPNIVLIPGTTKEKHLEENLAAGKIQLTPSEVQCLTAGPHAPNIELLAGPTKDVRLKENVPAGTALPADELQRLTEGAWKYRIVLDTSRIGAAFAKSEGYVLDSDVQWNAHLASMGFTPSGDGAWIAEGKSLQFIDDLIISKTRIE